MRVLHILNDVTDRGNGIVNAAVDLAIEQVRQGYSVAVVSAGGGYQPLLLRSGVYHLALTQSKDPVGIVRAAQLFRKHLQIFQPDVVHAHMRTGLLLAWWCRHFERYALVGHVHNVHDFESILMGLADRVIAVSESVGKTIAGWGIPRRKVRVVLNRTLNGARQPRLKDIEPAALAKPAIVTVCGMNPRKGIEELLTAFDQVASQFPDAQLYLVGDGPERSWFELLARRSPHFSRIHFEGYSATPQAYMLSADVFVLAARRESFGLVLLEARAAGCAIVATNADGIVEALDGGRSGMLVPPRNPSALANALCHMLGNDEMRMEWRRRAKVGIEEYSIERMANEIGDVYDEVADAKRWRESPGVAA